MPSFTKGPAYATPFGNHNFLRSTKNLKPEHYTVAAATVTAETIDTVSTKMLWKGELMAKITSGTAADIGKVGPYQPATDSANEVQTITINATGGSFKVGFGGGITAAVAWNATAAALQTALNTLLAVNPGDIVVTGGPGGTTAYTLTFGGQYAGGDVALVTTDPALLTGGAGTAAVALVTAGSAGTNGASDGRGEASNIVGLNNTYLPWQLRERDVEIACLYDCAAIQSLCFQRNATGVRVALTDATAQLMRSIKGLNIIFKV